MSDHQKERDAHPVGGWLVEVRMLGPTEVWLAGEPLPLQGVRQRAVLAMLALQVNRVVPTDRLIDGLWGQDPPPNAVGTVQVYISRLRKALLRGSSGGGQLTAAVHRRTPGYLLALDPAEVDVGCFQLLAADAAQALPTDPTLAASLFRRALDLWRGAPLAEFAGLPFAAAEVTRLEEERLAAVTGKVEADLATGRHRALVSELEALIVHHPLHEGLHADLILSLYRSGRQAEALDSYRRVRQRLADELGVDPGPALQALETAVLAHDSRLDYHPPTSTAAGLAHERTGMRSTAAGTVVDGDRRPSSVVWNVPARNPHFTGRADVLGELRDRLRAGSGTLVVQALYGLGGVGKTQLAVEYTHRFAADYDLAWWIDAGQRVLIPGQFADLAGPLGLPADGVTAEVATRVLTELGARDRWLLIFDNAEHPADITGYRPAGAGHVLVTSRAPEWGALGGRIEVDVLDRPDTVALLRARIPEMTVQTADQLAAELGDLPLAAAQAAGYLERTGLPSQDYLRRLRSHRAGVFAAGDVPDYQGGVDTTWAISLKRLQAISPVSVALLEISAFLAPEPIPLSLFTEHPELLDEPLHSTATDPDALADAVGAMVGFSLARRGRYGFQLHRLLQKVIRNRMTAGQHEHLTATTIALLAASTPGDPHEPANWAAYVHLAPHILATSALGDARQDGRSLQLRTITHLINSGQAEAAWSLAHQLHARWQGALGPDHLDTLTAAASLTAALTYLGKHEQARTVGQDALRRAHLTLGPHHLVTQRLASTTINLGVLGPMGSTVGAETPDTERIDELAEDARQLSLRNPGSDHPVTLVLSTNLPRALALVLDGEAATAHAEWADALRRSRNSVGPDHLATLGLAATLTLISVLQGLPEQARDLAEDTVTRCRNRLGANHFTTLFASATLALAQTRHGDADQARDLGEDTRERAGTTLGPDHPTTLAAAAAVSISLARLGATEQADILAADTLTRARHRLGHDHPVTRVLTRILLPTTPLAGNRHGDV